VSILQDSMLSLIKNNEGHFVAEDILIRLRENFPTVSLATVYRNLDKFTREEKIRRVAIVGCPGFYEGNLNPHDHAVCLRCGRVADITIPGLKQLAADSIQGEIVSLDLNVNYICRKCLEEANGEKNHENG
jgi:Fe2+ or Zn2+ uptake regulation protein